MQNTDFRIRIQSPKKDTPLPSQGPSSNGEPGFFFTGSSGEVFSCRTSRRTLIPSLSHLGKGLTEGVTERAEPSPHRAPVPLATSDLFGSALLCRPGSLDRGASPRQAEPPFSQAEKPTRWRLPALPGAGWLRRLGKWPTTCRRCRALTRSTSTIASSSRRSWRPSLGRRSEYVGGGSKARLPWGFRAPRQDFVFTYWF